MDRCRPSWPSRLRAPAQAGVRDGTRGLPGGLLFFGFTALYLIRGPVEGTNLWLLGQYFRFYRVTWPGAFMGFVWGFVVGFVAGWFIAFCRNLMLAISIFLIRAKADPEPGP